MANYHEHGRKRFFTSSEGWAPYHAKINQITRAFAELAPETQKACEAFALKYLVLDDERNSRQEQDLADAVELYEDQNAEEQSAEMSEIEQQISRWFPFVATSSDDDKSDYVLAYLEYMDLRRNAQ